MENVTKLWTVKINTVERFIIKPHANLSVYGMDLKNELSCIKMIV